MTFQRHLPAFAECEIQAGISRTTNRVASAALARQVMPERTHAEPEGKLRQVLRKEVHRAIWAYRRLGMSPAYLSGRSAQLPIGRPCSSVGDCHWEPRGPTGQPRKLPATNQSLGNTAGICGKQLTLTERQIDNPIRIELVRGVKVGDC